jgi:hypothetical protein
MHGKSACGTGGVRFDDGAELAVMGVYAKAEALFTRYGRKDGADPHRPRR